MEGVGSPSQEEFDLTTNVGWKPDARLERGSHFENE